MKILTISDQEKEALVNYITGHFTNTDFIILKEWLEKGEDNKIIFDQFVTIWQTSKFKDISSKIQIDKAWNELHSKIKPNKNPRIISWQEVIRIAAVFIISLFLGALGYYFLHKNWSTTSEPQYVEYVSPLGSRSFVQLSDGSRVWLNSGSTLKYKNSYGENRRELQLTGEAFFEAERNKNLPFIVKTSEMNITALGTKFNVKAYPEDKTIETTLIEGSVSLESTSVNLNQNVVLKPNEKAVFTKKNQSLALITKQDNKSKKAVTTSNTIPKLEIIESVEPAPVISWKDKRWVISNEKLGDLAVKLERRYDVNFIFDNDLLKEYSFGGTLEDESLDQVMKAIQFSSPVKYIIDDKTVYVMADGKKMEKFKHLLMK